MPKTGKRYEWEVGVASQDPFTATVQDYDWADEVLHAKIGRELYVSVLGNSRLEVFPIRELVFREVPPDEPKIATYRAKWDEEYRKK